MEELQQFLSSLNYTVPNLTMDGKIHRFPHGGKKDAGWYVGHQNHYVKTGKNYFYLTVSDWFLSEKHIYKPNDGSLGREDRKIISLQMQEDSKRYAAEKELAQKEAATYSEKVLADVTSGIRGTSPYIARKKIQEPNGIIINSDGIIFVPMTDVHGKLWGIQRILPEKDASGRDKKYIYRQRVSGCFFKIGSTELQDVTEIMLCEGFATGCTLHEVTSVTTVVAFDAGNLKAVAKELHLKFPSLIITVCADDDRFNESGNIGVKKATEAKDICNGILKIPKFTKDDHKGTDFNDLFCFEGEAVCKAQFSVKEEPKSGFFPLGYEGHDYYFYSVAQKDIVCVSTFSNTQMYALALKSYWEGNYPSQKGVAWDKAKDFLVAISRAVGPYDSFRIRGTGVWRDRGRVVVNTGRTLTVDGKSGSMLTVNSQYIYTRTKTPMPEIHPRPLTVEECAPLLSVCANLLWENPKSGILLAGWLATARISGALPIRPHVWITGGAGVGKSTIMEHLVANALGDPSSKIYAQGGTTEAGIRQTMKGSSMPMIFDEFETTDEKSTSGRVATIIEMFRQAWSESQGVILKGSASGASDMYSINFSALVASIRPSLVNDADKSRFSLLELTPHKSEKDQWGNLLVMLEKITPEFGERLFARMVTMVPTVIASAKNFSDAFAIKMGKRYGQQNGMLVAGFWALCSDTPINAEDAKGFVNSLELESEKDEIVPDHIECVMKLMTSQISVSDMGGNRIFMSIEEILRSNRIVDIGLLKNIGIYVGKDDSIIVNCNSEGVKRIYRDSRWANSFPKVLYRMNHSTDRRHWSVDLKKQIHGIRIFPSRLN
jgi:putative DNA primase/helicase